MRYSIRSDFIKENTRPSIEWRKLNQRQFDALLKSGILKEKAVEMLKLLPRAHLIESLLCKAMLQAGGGYSKVKGKYRKVFDEANYYHFRYIDPPKHFEKTDRMVIMFNKRSFITRSVLEDKELELFLQLLNFQFNRKVITTDKLHFEITKYKVDDDIFYNIKPAIPRTVKIVKCSNCDKKFDADGKCDCDTLKERLGIEE